MNKNAKKFIQLYLQKSEESFEKWGYYYPPRNWQEFESWNQRTYEKHLSKDGYEEDPIKRTKIYLSLLNTLNPFGYFYVFDEGNWQDLNNVIFQTSRRKLLHHSTLASGTDQCNILEYAASCWASNDFGVIDSLLPQNLPYSKGRYYTEVTVNLLRVLYYNEPEKKQECLDKATKFLNKKITGWEKNLVGYFVALVNEDAKEASLCLQQLCADYQRLGHPKEKHDKCYAQEIHGYYRFARTVNENLFNEIEIPTHPCFFQEFEIWQKENKYPIGTLFYTYPEHLGYMNEILKAPIPKMTLMEKKYKRVEIMKDVEKFATDLTENVLKYRGSLKA